jgi:hypothetical protein
MENRSNNIMPDACVHLSNRRALFAVYMTMRSALINFHWAVIDTGIRYQQ